MGKRTTVTLALLGMALIMGAQIPQKFNYQAVVRDSQRALLSSQDVGFRMTVLKGSALGESVYEETHLVMTSDMGVADLMIGEGSVISGDFKGIQWGEDIYYLKVEADPAGGNSYEHLGTSQLISVPYSLYSGNISSPTRKFTIQEETGHPIDSALFEVRNAEGQTVFAVYPEGTRVYILDENTKGVKGGFAVGGFRRSAKGISNEFLRITPDSIRLYVDENATKGVGGGFAVAGFSRSGEKLAGEYFTVKPDSAKFELVSEAPEGVVANALTVTTRSKVGAATKFSQNLFNLTRDNYFIGHKAGASITDGSQNCFFGYASGSSTTTGYGNIFFGEESGLSNTEGSYNAFIGYKTGNQNTTGINNIFLGFAAGEKNIRGVGNIYIGSDAGQFSQGNHNTFFGTGAGTNNKEGHNNVFLGNNAGGQADTAVANIFIGSEAGFRSKSGEANVFIGNATGLNNMGGHNTFVGHGSGQHNNSGEFNTFLGAYTGHRLERGNANTFIGQSAGGEHVEGGDNTFIGADAGLNDLTGFANVYIGSHAGQNNNAGNNNVFIGYEAGADVVGSGKLIIDNHNRPQEETLIYGEFFDHHVRINDRLGIGMTPLTHSLEVQGDVAKTVAGDWQAVSDARVKTDVLDIRNAREQILKLRPIKFRYTEEWMSLNPSIKNKEYYNFIAQEFQQVFPDAVSRGAGQLEAGSESLLQMDSYPAQVVAIKAIQELIRENNEQQHLIEQLQLENAELKEMEARIGQLEERISAGGF